MRCRFFFVSILFLFLFGGCGSYNNKKSVPSVVGDIDDKPQWWIDETVQFDKMYVTIPQPNDYLCKPYNDLTAPERPCTLEDINHDIDAFDSYEPKLHVIFRTDSYATTQTTPNATFKLKGDYSRTNAQKSYTVKLDSKEYLYEGQRRIKLTKSQSDQSRLRNKVAFELFKKIPNITSLNVKFAELFIDDVTYGLFSQIEAIDKYYLKRRGWNEDDRMYKVENFLFESTENLELNPDGSPKDPEKFDINLKIKSGKDHRALLEMIHAVETATTKNIDQVIQTYFNRKNYVTWLAFNLIVNNKDVMYHNYYLYNPKYSKTFYFIPYDYDGGWSHKQYLQRYEYGISTYWRALLHKKFLSVKKNRDEVYQMADELRQKYVTDEAIKAIVAKWEKVVRPFQSKYPDNQHNSDASWLRASQELWQKIPDFIALYKSAIGWPMPFEEYAQYSKKSQTLYIEWEKSVDFEGDEIVYDVNVSKNTYSNVIITKTDINATSISIPIALDPGKYFIKVVSKEKNNPQNYMIGYALAEENGTELYGVQELIVE